MDRDSSVGIVTHYGQDGSGIESRWWWGPESPQMSRSLLESTQPPVQWVLGHFPEVKRPGRGPNQPPHLEPRLKKEQSYTSTPPLCLHD